MEVFTLSRERGTQQVDSILVHRVPAAATLEQCVAKTRFVRRYFGYVKAFSLAWVLDRTLRNRHRTAPFDVIQAAGSLGCGLLAASRKSPAVVTRVSSYKPALRDATQQPSTRRTDQADWAQAQQLRRSTAVYAPSRLVAEIVHRREGVKVEVVEPAFDCDALQGYRDQLPVDLHRESYGLYFGAVSVLKGCDRLCDVLPDLLRRNPAMRFVFVGKTLKEARGATLDSKLQGLLGSFGDRVAVLPQQRQEALFPLVANARFVVLPSRMDNLPNACLEAMALRRVVIATRGASFEQLIEDGVNGFLVSQSDDAELSNRMESTWQMDLKHREKIGDAAHRSLERLKPEHAIQSLVALFESVVAANGACKRGRQVGTCPVEHSPAMQRHVP